MQKLKKGDEVIVIVGRDKGKKGAILRIINGVRLIVEGVNIVKKHMKANPSKEKAGGIIEREASLHISNVAILNPLTKRADRVGVKFLKDNKKVRFFKSNGEVIDA